MISYFWIVCRKTHNLLKSASFGYVFKLTTYRRITPEKYSGQIISIDIIDDVKYTERLQTEYLTFIVPFTI